MTTTNDAPAPAPSGVRVKPLEWSLGRATADDDDGGHFGCWAGGWYQIRREGRGKWTAGTHETWAPGKKASGQWRNLGVFSSKNEAKAAAQADYEARIRASLASDASPRGELERLTKERDDAVERYGIATAEAAKLRARVEDQRKTILRYMNEPIPAHPAPATVKSADLELICRLVIPMVAERSREPGDAWHRAQHVLAALAPATEGGS